MTERDPPHMLPLIWRPGLMSSSDTRHVECQHHADLPYVFSVSNKLSKLIGRMSLSWLNQWAYGKPA